MSTADHVPTSPLSRRNVLLGAAAGTGILTVGSLVTATEADADYNWSRTLQQGMTGNDVRALQVRVAGFAASSPSMTYVAVDGIFGSQTYWAVRRFQSAWGLTVDGIAGPQTQGQLNWLEYSNGSTRHFAYSEFYSNDGSGFSGGKVGSSTVKRNVRWLMWKLEALRRKAGNNAVIINSGFRSISHNAAVGGASNSQHMYGIAADIRVVNRSVSQVKYYAKTSGFSGVIGYSSHTHVDSRVEYPYGATNWYWP